MDLTFKVPMQYCSLQHWTLLLSPVTSTTGCCFCFGSVPSFFLELFLHRSQVAYWATYRPGEFIFQCPIFLPFHTVHGVLKARILKWLAIPFSSGPHSVSKKCVIQQESGKKILKTIFSLYYFLLSSINLFID